jgi:hypothetical protein
MGFPGLILGQRENASVEWGSCVSCIFPCLELVFPSAFSSTLLRRSSVLRNHDNENVPEQTKSLTGAQTCSRQSKMHDHCAAVLETNRSTSRGLATREWESPAGGARRVAFTAAIRAETLVLTVIQVRSREPRRPHWIRSPNG